MTLRMRDAEMRAEGREEGRAEGREEGRAEGRAEGLEEGLEKGFRAQVLLLKKLNVSFEEAFRLITSNPLYSNLSKEQVELLFGE